MKYKIVMFSDLEQQNRADSLKQWLFLPEFLMLECAFTLFNNKICFLLEKYGVVPKKCFPESYTTEATRRMNDILNHKVQPMEQGGIEFSALTLKLLPNIPRGFLGISVYTVYIQSSYSVSIKGNIATC